MILIFVRRKLISFYSSKEGSGRLSPRNRQIADLFNKAGFSTLLVDLLNETEVAKDSNMMDYRFDIQLLGAQSGSTLIQASTDSFHHLQTTTLNNPIINLKITSELLLARIDTNPSGESSLISASRVSPLHQD